jgi:hypothetical protein
VLPKDGLVEILKNKILQMMIAEKVGSNANCVQCRDSEEFLTHALSPWVICNKEKSSQSILFVGKIARGDYLGEEISDALENVVPFGTDFIKKSSWAYWAYTRAIIESVYGDLETGLKYISFSNMVKCNNESTPDTSSHAAKDQCIRKNQFIWKEIEILKPRLVIFYTNTDYDEFIDEFAPSYSTRHIDHTSRTNLVQIGAKSMPWWNRSFFDSHNSSVLTFIRVGHPERKKKENC